MGSSPAISFMTAWKRGWSAITSGWAAVIASSS